jgi:hypothetical protein
MGQSNVAGEESGLIRQHQEELSKKDQQLERLREHLLEMETTHTTDAIAREQVCGASNITRKGRPGLGTMYGR